jgi:hypothetical protein
MPKALTTTFTPSPSCLSDYYLIGSPPYLSLGPPSTSACLPSGWEVTSQYFSPGLCPSGYEIACSAVIGLGTFAETRATCCPSGYSCQMLAIYSFYSTDQCTLPSSSLPAVITVTTSSNSTTLISLPHCAVVVVQMLMASLFVFNPRISQRRLALLLQLPQALLQLPQALHQLPQALPQLSLQLLRPHPT